MVCPFAGTVPVPILPVPRSSNTVPSETSAIARHGASCIWEARDARYDKAIGFGSEGPLLPPRQARVGCGARGHGGFVAGATAGLGGLRDPDRRPPRCGPAAQR